MDRMNDIDDGKLAELVQRFYAKVRCDPLIGPLFNSAIDDWPHHLDHLTDFWSSVMTGSGRFKGNPMAKHLKHADAIHPEMFERWLALWRETTHEVFTPDQAAAFVAKAERIAESLQLGLHFRPDRPFSADALTSRQSLPATEDRELSLKPEEKADAYKVTPVFDEVTLPAALRRDHRTKAGTWGVIRVLDGTLRLHFADGRPAIDLTSEKTAVVSPEETHWVEPLGAMRMQVAFYRQCPRG